MNGLRVAILTHSVNPRGGVAHALALGEALCGLGHEAVVHAPDPEGCGFYRAAACPTVRVAAEPVAGSAADRVEARINAYLRHFAQPHARRFDVFHAHCGIGGNGLATLSRRRLIAGFARTVHHVDRFDDPRLAIWQERAIVDAARLLCVSRVWRDALARDYGVPAEIVGNGVDTAVFTPEPRAEDAPALAAYGIVGPGPVFLAVGGFEARKNTLRSIRAFALLRQELPGAQLVVAGGASLLDHAEYRRQVQAEIDALGLALGPGCPVVGTGSVPQALMPALYRRADSLVLPSLMEGFGLAVLEAMACGTPTVVSRRAPFTEYLGSRDAVFVDPEDADDIAGGMRAALHPDLRARLVPTGLRVAALHGWAACARRHLPAYEALSVLEESRLHA